MKGLPAATAERLLLDRLPDPWRNAGAGGKVRPNYDIKQHRMLRCHTWFTPTNVAG